MKLSEWIKRKLKRKAGRPEKYFAGRAVSYTLAEVGR
jgi:hypothetical protein